MAVELKAIASLDGKPFEDGARRVRGATAGAEKDIGAMRQSLGNLKSAIIGAFGVGAIMSFGRKMLSTADDMATAAASVGITLDSMVALSAAMAESGIKSDAFLRIMSRLPRAQSEVNEGNKTMVEALKALNISQDEFVALAPDALLERVARAYNEAGGSAAAFGAIGQVFGERIGPSLIEVFQLIGRDGLDGFREKTAGSSEGILQLAEASDTLERTWNKVIIKAANLVSWITMVGKAAKEAAKAADFKPKGYLEIAGAVLSPPAYLAYKAIRNRKAIAQGAMDTLTEPTELERARPAEQARQSATAAANAAELAARREAEAAQATAKAQQDATKAADERFKITQKAIEFNRAASDIEAERAAGIAQTQAGKGIATPAMGAADSFQRMGLLVGNPAGNQAARIAERQASIQQEIRDISKRMDDKLAMLDRRIADWQTDMGQ